MQLDLHASDEELQRVAKAEGRTDRIVNSAVIAILLVLTCGVAFWIYGQHLRAVRLDTQGERVIATVDYDYTKWKRTRSGEVRYEVTYWFHVGDIRYEGSGMLRRAPLPGGAATVIYDPVDPNNNILEGSDPFQSRSPGTIAILMFAYALAGIRYLYRKVKSG